MCNRPKITLIYDNGFGDISRVSIESEYLHDLSFVTEWLNAAGLEGIGFSSRGPQYGDKQSPRNS